ncbi:hypothetical protein F5Y16DRAFT_375005 [Xylariaceae sp. FL0255]|nr:hypothetical protein F5Y16DRAFT_375005 [Xylariaceae sp. FL0255]
MSSKRKYSDYKSGSTGDEESKPRERIPGFHPSRRNKKAAKVKPNNINWTKKRTRTIERRLKHSDTLPANVLNDLERELEHHKSKLGDLNDEKRRKNMIKKYHMVRFFERKKADRLAKQIRTQLKSTTDPADIEKLQADLHIAEIDALYAKHFPHRERYISLYPVAALGLSTQGGAKPEDASSAARALHSERPPMWKVIEEAAVKGSRALTAITERKTPPEQRKNDFAVTKQARSKAKDLGTLEVADSRKGKGKDNQHQQTGKRQKPQKPSSNPSSSDDDSDGGFFE